MQIADPRVEQSRVLTVTIIHSNNDNIIAPLPPLPLLGILPYAHFRSTVVLYSI